jgi:hypothetical protein
MKHLLVHLCACTALLVAGCFSAKAPEKIYIGTGPQPADIDSSSVPHTETHEQARAELIKAYQQIRYLEDRYDRCRSKLEDARAEADEYEEKYERLKDQRDD